MENLNIKQKLILGLLAVAMIITVIFYIIQNFIEEEPNYDDYSSLEKENENIVTAEQKQIKVHIAGCVVEEGVVTLSEGARIADAIEEAGGTTLDANIKDINLAYVLKDGQKVYIPSNIEDEVAYVTSQSGENIVTTGIGSLSNSIENSSEKININSATQAELETLTGIGPSTALKIIQFRQANGEFSKIEDLKNVPSIGDSKFDAIKENIEV